MLAPSKVKETLRGNRKAEFFVIIPTLHAVDTIQMVYERRSTKVNVALPNCDDSPSLTSGRIILKLDAVSTMRMNAKLACAMRKMKGSCDNMVQIGL